MDGGSLDISQPFTTNGRGFIATTLLAEDQRFAVGVCRGIELASRFVGGLLLSALRFSVGRKLGRKLCPDRRALARKDSSARLGVRDFAYAAWSARRNPGWPAVRRAQRFAACPQEARKLFPTRSSLRRHLTPGGRSRELASEEMRSW